MKCIFTSFIDKFCRLSSELFVYIIINLIMISQTLIHCLNKYILKEKHILFLRNERKYFIEKKYLNSYFHQGWKYESITSGFLQELFQFNSLFLPFFLFTISNIY